MLSITEVNFNRLYDESVLMFDVVDEEVLHQIIAEGIIPDKIKQRATHIINKWGKVDPKQKIKELEDKLKNQGVEAKKITDVATRHARLASKEIRRNIKDPKKMGSIIKSHYRAAEAEVLELTEAEKWGGSVLILILVLIIAGFLQIILSVICISLGFQPIIGMILGAIFIAPLVEESAKFVSIKRKMTGQYFAVFNIAEFGLYLGALTASGIPLLTAAILRLIAVGVHGATTFIQWKARKIGEEKGELDDKTAKKGLGLSMVLHGAYNFLASLGSF